MTNTLFEEMTPQERRLFNLLHYTEETSLTGFCIHLALRNKTKESFRELLKFLKDQYNDNRSRPRLIKCIGNDCAEILSTIKTV